MEQGWKVWFHKLNSRGEIYAGGVLPYAYKHKRSAGRRAKKNFGKDTNTEWCVSQTNPYPALCRNCGKNCRAKALLNYCT